MPLLVLFMVLTVIRLFELYCNLIVYVWQLLFARFMYSNRNCFSLRYIFQIFPNSFNYVIIQVIVLMKEHFIFLFVRTTTIVSTFHFFSYLAILENPYYCIVCVSFSRLGLYVVSPTVIKTHGGLNLTTFFF